MGLIQKTEHNFGELKQTRFNEAETPFEVWGPTSKSVPTAPQNVDVLEQLRFNIDQMNDLNARFQFLLEELSGVLVRRKN